MCFLKALCASTALLINGSVKILTEQQEQATWARKSFGIRLEQAGGYTPVLPIALHSRTRPWICQSTLEGVKSRPAPGSGPGLGIRSNSQTSPWIYPQTQYVVAPSHTPGQTPGSAPALGIRLYPDEPLDLPLDSVSGRTPTPVDIPPDLESRHTQTNPWICPSTRYQAAPLPCTPAQSAPLDCTPGLGCTPGAAGEPNRPRVRCWTSRWIRPPPVPSALTPRTKQTKVTHLSACWTESVFVCSYSVPAKPTNLKQNQQPL